MHEACSAGKVARCGATNANVHRNNAKAQPCVHCTFEFNVLYIKKRKAAATPSLIVGECAVYPSLNATGNPILPPIVGSVMRVAINSSNEGNFKISSSASGSSGFSPRLMK